MACSAGGDGSGRLKRQRDRAARKRAYQSPCGCRFTTRVGLRIDLSICGTGAIWLIGIGAQPLSEPHQLGCCSATPRLPHFVQRAACLGMSRQPSSLRGGSSSRSRSRPRKFRPAYLIAMRRECNLLVLAAPVPRIQSRRLQ